MLGGKLCEKRSVHHGKLKERVMIHERLFSPTAACHRNRLSLPKEGACSAKWTDNCLEATTAGNWKQVQFEETLGVTYLRFKAGEGNVGGFTSEVVGAWIIVCKAKTVIADSLSSCIS